MAKRKVSKRKTVEERSMTITDPVYAAWTNKNISDTGITVTPEGALSQSTFYSCLELLAGSISFLDLHLFKKNKNSRDRVYDGVIANFIDRPNTIYSFRQMMEIAVRHIVMFGNAYAGLDSPTGNTIRATLLNPNNVELKVINGMPVYYYRTKDNETVEVPSAMMLHFKRFTLDGFKGISLIDHARSTLGFAMAAESYGARWFRNSSKVGGVLTVPGILSKNAQPIRDWTRKQLDAVTNNENAFSTMIMDSATEFKPMHVTMRENQFHEIRQHSPTEIAKFFGIPNGLLDISGGTTGHTYEQLTQHFLTFTLFKWLEMIQDEINYKLDLKNQNMYVEYKTEKVLAIDELKKHQIFDMRVKNGTMGAMEVRRICNEPEIENLNYFAMPLNQVYLDANTGEILNFNVKAVPTVGQTTGNDVADQAVRSAQQGGETAIGAMPQTSLEAFSEARTTDPTQTTVSAPGAFVETRNAFSKLLRAAVERLLNKEKLVLRKAWNKRRNTNDVAEFRNDVNSFYSKHVDMTTDHLSAIVESYADLTGAPIDIDATVNAHIQESKSRLIQELNKDSDNPFENLEVIIDQFGENRPDLIEGN